MKFAIVDDSLKDRSILKSYIISYISENQISADLHEFECAENFLAVYQKEEFDVVFLDIYMKGKSGMEVAQEIFSSQCRCKIIFLSGSTDFFRQSYSVRAVYYLVKPIVLKEFKLAMCFLELRPEYTVQFIEITQNGTKHSIPTEKILYIDVQNHTTSIHLINETITLCTSFKVLTEPLNLDERFLRCIRGVIINMQFVIGIDKNMFVLDNNMKIPINIRHKKHIEQKWRAYLYKHMGER